MRVVVTGRDGQVVRALMERGPAGMADVVALGRPSLDLADPAGVAAVLAEAMPDVIVNAAAYTGVDKAEQEPEQAWAVNAAGAKAVAEAAASLGVPVIQISTDYVFDGSLDRPYREDDPTAPLGIYGQSKRAGEEAVAAATANHAILRTAWVYSPFGANFVKTMLRVAAGRDALGVVGDQIGCPTSALDMADAILRVARNLVERPDPALRGTFHMSGSGETSWAAFAEAIFQASRNAGGPTARVNPITTADYPTPARRPANSRLDCTKLARLHGAALPPWQDAVERCVIRLVKDSTP
ncbi:dTDP-4-dehydrorhamnose reductase [Lichenihabitans sp. Uapishka_5]|uniref:dTDP-4-dehydrorhamnose reductase n=1 Tax=Lichenihabitans sp. Uapishka_5 TaxID=3037302 RepID=UPI0029E7F800|nr:dTDP-4-dehydrorhamnose reductase [Lichenihabitans sp. Uapishka_5]MDX7950376.1 dTDP-4-dehydrorhamnose reductase [Lichenihabitans sp. Uapishka_5]